MCKEVLKQYIDELSKKANDTVLNPDIYEESDDEEGGDDMDDEQTVEEECDDDNDVIVVDAGHGSVDSLINKISWKRPSLSL